MPKVSGSAFLKGAKKVQNFLNPIGKSFKGLSARRKAAVIGGGAALGVGGLALGSSGNTTINKMAEDSFIDELQKLAKKTHPVSKAQERWAFAAEDRGELPKGKAEAWAKRKDISKLPEHSKKSSDSIAEKAFKDEMDKLANEKGLKKLVKKIHAKHPEAFKGITEK